MSRRTRLIGMLIGAGLIVYGAAVAGQGSSTDFGIGCMVVGLAVIVLTRSLGRRIRRRDGGVGGAPASPRSGRDATRDEGGPGGGDGNGE